MCIMYLGRPTGIEGVARQDYAKGNHAPRILHLSELPGTSVGKGLSSDHVPVLLEQYQGRDKAPENMQLVAWATGALCLALAFRILQLVQIRCQLSFQLQLHNSNCFQSLHFFCSRS